VSMLYRRIVEDAQQITYRMLSRYTIPDTSPTTHNMLQFITRILANRSRVANRSQAANISLVNTQLRSSYQVYVQVLDDVHATDTLLIPIFWCLC